AQDDAATASKEIEVMTAPGTLLLMELAKRCEAASGPDRELDVLIWWHLTQPRYAVVDAVLEIEAEGRGIDLDHSKSGVVVPLDELMRCHLAPSLTASLD